MSFSVDTLATVRKLRALVGSVFFPPAAVLALVELGGSNAKDDLCLKRAAEREREAPLGNN